MNTDQMSDEMLERQRKLLEIRNKLREKGEDETSKTVNQGSSTPRTRELINELDNFRPKTPAKFKPEY
jgi:hypothetical protein